MRRLWFAVVSAALVVACAGAQSNSPAGASRPAGTQPAAASQPAPPAGGGGGADLSAAAAAIKDVCTIIPLDLISPLVPGATAPQTSPFPPRCIVANQNQAVEVTLGAYDTGGHPVAGAESIPDLAAGGFYEAPAKDEAYVTVNLTPTTGNLYVDVALHDGKDHKADAIAIAKAILAKLK